MLVFTGQAFFFFKVEVLYVHYLIKTPNSPIIITIPILWMKKSSLRE